MTAIHEETHPTAATAAFLSPDDLTPSPEEVLAAKNAEIADLKARLEAQTLKGNHRPVELANGSSLPVKEAEKQLSEMSLEAQVEILRTQRYIDEMKAHSFATNNAVTPLSSQPPLLTKDAAIGLIGLAAWQALPNADKAIVLDTRQSDVAAHKVETIFGPGSDSRAAHELAKSNLAVYKLLKLQAKNKGLI